MDLYPSRTWSNINLQSTKSRFSNTQPINTITRLFTSITAPRVYVLYRYVCVGIGVDISLFDVHLKVFRYIIYLVGFLSFVHKIK